MSKQTLKFLGKGSAFNTDLGNNSAYIEKDNSLYLIDCGELTFKEVKDNINLSEKENIVVAITHLHPDHVGSLGSLIFYCKYVLNKMPTIIHKYDNELRDLLLANGLVVGFHYNIVKRYVDCNISIYPTDTDHVYVNKNITTGDIACDKPGGVYDYELFNSTSLIINYDNKLIFYSGDTSECILGEQDKFDEIYHDATAFNYPNSPHINIDKLDNELSEHNKENLFIMHIDSEDTINKALDYGFNVVKTIHEEEE